MKVVVYGCWVLCFELVLVDEGINGLVPLVLHVSANLNWKRWLKQALDNIRPFPFLIYILWRLVVSNGPCFWGFRYCCCSR